MADRPEINWTRPMLERFKRAHYEASEKRAEEFTFDGHEFVTGYAKYLIEYLDEKLRR